MPKTLKLGTATISDADPNLNQQQKDEIKKHLKAIKDILDRANATGVSIPVDNDVIKLTS